MEGIREKRPVFLLVLCILSFVYIGFSILFGAGSLAQGPETKQEMAREMEEFDKGIAELEKNGNTQMVATFEKYRDFALEANRKFYGVQIVSLLVLGLGLISVLKMFKGDKLGFHLYIVYSLLSIGQVYFFISPAMVPTSLVIFTLVISAIFVGLYAINLRWLR